MSLKSKNIQHRTVSLSLVVTAIVLLAINMRAPIVMLGSIAPIIEQQLSITQAHIGWLGAIPMLMFAFGALLSSHFSQRFGLQNLLLAMIILLIFGIVLRVLIVGWWWFFIGTVLLSLAIGFLNTLAAPVIKKLAPNNIALVTGVFSLTMTICAGISAGVVLPMSAQLGWRWATGSWVVISIFALILWFALRSLLAYEPPTPVKIVAVQKVNIWRRPLAWYIAIFLGIQSIQYYTLASFLPSIWLDKGLTLSQAGRMATVFQLMAPISIVVLTWIMNRYNKRRIAQPVRPIAVIGAACIVIGTGGMAYHTDITPNWALVWSCCMGIGGSMIFTLVLMLLSLRSHNTRQAGALSGMVQTVGYTIAILGPLGTGWLHEVSGGWDIPLMVINVFMVVNLFFAWMASKAMMIDGQPLSSS